MYPLIQIGPFALSSGGLFLLLAAIVGGWLTARIAQSRGDARFVSHAESCYYAALLGAAIGGRLWYGLFHPELYGPHPGLYFAPRVEAFAWPGALLGGLATGWLWTRWRGAPFLPLADAIALALPISLIIGSIGLLLSGEAFGAPTSLPWAIDLFGATRHPTQIYLMLAALIMLIILRRLATQRLPDGTLLMALLGLQGITMLLIEAWRGDSLLLPGGIRAAQIAGLVLIVTALLWARRQPMTHAQPSSAHESGVTLEAAPFNDS